MITLPSKIIAFFLLVLASPIMLVIALFIKFKMPNGSILFQQKRIGKGGAPFLLKKFRTMRMEHNGSNITVMGQSRITPLGVFLRKYKLDELPQLFNILNGEMTFVGPRPDVPGYADKLIGEERKILNLLPGITGLASLKYYNEEEILAQQNDPKKYNDKVIYPDKVKINLEYYYNRSLWLDCKIILQSISAVFK